MGFQMGGKSRLRLVGGLAVMLAGIVPAAAGAAPRDVNVASFAALSRSVDALAVVPEEGGLQWSAPDMNTRVEVSPSEDIYRSRGEQAAGQSAQGQTFEHDARPHHGGNGGGWGDRGEFDDDPRGRCDDRCGVPSPVPEPTRASLMVAGAVAMLILVRRRRGGAGLFASR